MTAGWCPRVIEMACFSRFSGSAPNVQMNPVADTTPNNHEANERTGFETDAEGASFKTGKIDAQRTVSAWHRSRCLSLPFNPDSRTI